MHRSASARTHGFPRFVFAVLAGLVVLTTSAAAFAQARGSLIILGLRAPDGDDEAAANATTALRRAARNAGYEVPNDSPALEQSMASFGCDDSLPPTCLTQIATDLHAQRMVYGAVHRHGRGREATLSIEVSLFDVGSQNTTARDQVEVPRALAHDSDSLNQSATRLIGTIAPAPAVDNNPPPTSSAPPTTTPVSHPAPIRRYISYAAIGLGGAALITGVVMGVLWFTSSNDPNWLMYHPELENTDNQLCRMAAMDLMAMNPSTYAGAADRTCRTAGTYQSAGWALGGVGAALLVAGVVLLVTDHSGDAQTGDHTASNTRSRRPRVNFVPTLSPGYQGATLSLTF